MADETAVTEPAHESGGGHKGGGAGAAFLAQKWGPAPAGVWLLGGGIAVAGALYLRGRLSGGTSTGPGSIDPASGQPYQAEAYDPASGATYASEYEALQQQIDQAAGGGTGSQTPTGGPPYATNAAWADAAVNYLESLGYSGSAATVAIQTYLSGGTPTLAQQQMIDRALQYLHAPPDLPTGGSTAPLPKTPKPTGNLKGHELARATGLKVTGSPDSHGAGLSWTAVPGAVGYQMFYSLPSPRKWLKGPHTNGPAGRIELPETRRKYIVTVAGIGTDGVDGPYATGVPVTLPPAKKGE